MSKTKPRTAKEKIDYLYKHETHSEWNDDTGYAHNVKLHHIINRYDKGWETACYLIDTELHDGVEIWEDIQTAFDEFGESHPGYDITWGGRSSGWLVLVSDQGAPFWYGIVRLKEMEYDELKQLFELVWDFDTLIDRLVEDFIAFCRTHHVEERQREVVRIVKYFEVVPNTEEESE